MADTRSQLIDSTRESIRELGLAGATAREITGRASANLGSITYHFGSKEVLVTEALIAEARELVAPVLELLTGEDPGPERAARAATQLIEVFDRSRTQIPVYLAALAAAPHQPEVRAGLAALWDEVTDHLATDVERQRDDGLLPAWVRPRPMASVIVAVVNGVVVAAALDPEGVDHTAIAAQFLALLLSARPDA